MSKTEEIALARMGIAGVESSTPRPMTNKLLADIVADNRNPVHPMAPAAAEPVKPDGAVGVVTGTDGAGWTSTPSLDAWRPPDDRAANALFDAEDRRFRAEREAELAAARARARGGA